MGKNDEKKTLPGPPLLPLSPPSGSHGADEGGPWWGGAWRARGRGPQRTRPPAQRRRSQSPAVLSPAAATAAVSHPAAAYAQHDGADQERGEQQQQQPDESEQQPAPPGRGRGVARQDVLYANFRWKVSKLEFYSGTIKAVLYRSDYKVNLKCRNYRVDKLFHL